MREQVNSGLRWNDKKGVVLDASQITGGINQLRLSMTTGDALAVHHSHVSGLVLKLIRERVNSGRESACYRMDTGLRQYGKGVKY